MCERPGRMTGSQCSRFSGRVPNVSHDEALQALKAELPTDAAVQQSAYEPKSGSLTPDFSQHYVADNCARRSVTPS